VAATGTAGARVPSLQTSPDGSVMCGSDWHCRCAPPVVAGESKRLAISVRASHLYGRVRERLRVVWRRPVPLPSKTWTLTVRASHHRGRVPLAFLCHTCKGSGRKLSSDHMGESPSPFSVTLAKVLDESSAQIIFRPVTRFPS
jgi:hypothetical protein